MRSLKVLLIALLSASIPVTVGQQKLLNATLPTPPLFPQMPLAANPFGMPSPPLMGFPMFKMPGQAPGFSMPLSGIMPPFPGAPAGQASGIPPFSPIPPLPFPPTPTPAARVPLPAPFPLQIPLPTVLPGPFPTIMPPLPPFPPPFPLPFPRLPLPAMPIPTPIPPPMIPFSPPVDFFYCSAHASFALTLATTPKGPLMATAPLPPLVAPPPVAASRDGDPEVGMARMPIPPPMPLNAPIESRQLCRYIATGSAISCTACCQAAAHYSPLMPEQVTGLLLLFDPTRPPIPAINIGISARKKRTVLFPSGNPPPIGNKTVVVDNRRYQCMCCAPRNLIQYHT